MTSTGATLRSVTASNSTKPAKQPPSSAHEASPTRAALERVIGHDLAVPGLRPRLHLPILAGLARGPGFPNLSCLGLLADRVLGAYVDVRRPDHQGLGVARRPTTGGATSGGPRGG